MRTVIAAFLGALIIVGSASSAQAAPVTLYVYGTIDSYVRGGVTDHIPVGSALDMTLTWETTTPASATTPTTATYTNALDSAFVLANDVSFLMTPRDGGSSSLSVVNDLDFDHLIGSMSDSTSYSSSSEFRLWQTKWDLLFPADTFSSTDLPSERISSTDGGVAKLYIYSREQDQDVVVHATIRGARSVPEPSTLLFLSMGLLGGGVCLRRRNRLARG